MLLRTVETKFALHKHKACRTVPQYSYYYFHSYMLLLSHHQNHHHHLTIITTSTTSGRSPIPRESNDLGWRPDRWASGLLHTYIRPIVHACLETIGLLSCMHWGWTWTRAVTTAMQPKILFQDNELRSQARWLDKELEEEDEVIWSVHVRSSGIPSQP